MLKITNLSYEGNGKKLNEINFHIEQGDFFVLFGPEESGKTELLHTIMGMLLPDSGDIEYKGEHISKISSKLRKTIRYVPEGVLLLEHITGKAYINSMIRTYKSGTQEQIEELETYFDVDTNQFLMDMTYRENKLTALIAAIVTKPELLILDEPFVYFSESLKEKVLEKLKLLNEEGVTVVIAVRHYEDVLDYRKRFLYLKEGSVIACEKEDKNVNFVKKIVVKKGDFQKLDACFDVPIMRTNRVSVYLSDLDWDKIGQILKECHVSDRDVCIQMASKEEILENYKKKGKN